MLPYKEESPRVTFCLEYYNFDWENNIVVFVDEKTSGRIWTEEKYYGAIEI